jgi:hypothetical protein
MTAKKQFLTLHGLTYEDQALLWLVQTFQAPLHLVDQVLGGDFRQIQRHCGDRVQKLIRELRSALGRWMRPQCGWGEMTKSGKMVTRL